MAGVRGTSPVDIVISFDTFSATITPDGNGDYDYTYPAELTDLLETGDYISLTPAGGTEGLILYDPSGAALSGQLLNVTANVNTLINSVNSLTVSLSSTDEAITLLATKEELEAVAALVVPITVTSAEVTASTEDSAYTYTFTATSRDSAALTITATTKPDWLAFTDNTDGTATLAGTPDNGDVGDHSVVLSVTDGTDTETQSFTITVANVNDAPTFTSSEITTATEDSAYSYSVTTSDVDAGDTLTITATTKPDWLTLTDNTDGTATLAGTPLNADVGDNSVVLTVSDGTASTDQSFTIAVTNTNDALTFTSSTVTTATEDSVYTYNIVTDDLDVGDTITITAPTKPAWLTFTDNTDGTATLTGTPLTADVGTDSVVISATDGTTPVTQSFDIVISAAGAGGLWTPVGKSWIKTALDVEDSTITLNGSNVSAMADISGSGNHAAQTDVARQMPYTAVDSRAGDQPTIGSTVTAGQFGLDLPSMGVKRLYVGTTYKAGASTGFETYDALLMRTSDGASSSRPRVIGDIGESNWGDYATVFASSSRINGGADSVDALPLPLSVVTITAPAIVTEAWSLFYQPLQDGRTWPGATVHYGMTDGTETDAERDKYEGWIAHKYGITLDAGHTWFSTPPTE